MSSSFSLPPALQALQQRLQHTFADPALLQRAITHRSFSAEHNERLEFLGDSVLNLAVSSLLYERLARLPEGDLSRVRANLVKQDTLHQLALGLQLPQVLRLGEGETKSGGKQRPSILADALEAVIGAVYLDAGFAPAQALVHRLFERIEINPQMQAASKDAKTALQEWLQARKMKPPNTTWSPPWARPTARLLKSSAPLPPWRSAHAARVPRAAPVSKLPLPPC